MASQKRPRRTKKTGPAAEVLKISGNWRDAVKKAMTKKKPPGGWPKAAK